MIKKYSSLSEFVSTTRENLGYSQLGLSKRCNLPIEDIQSIESGIDIFLSTTVRQKLAKGLKTTPAEIKQYEKNENFNFADENIIKELKNAILDNENNKGFVAICPVCKAKLVTRIAKMYDLEDNLMLHPKARCSKCPFQIT